MRSRIKALFVVAVFLVQLYPVAHLHPEPAQIIAKSSAQDFSRSVSLPQKERLTLVSVVQVTVAGKVLGGLAGYDDTATARPADYLELYNNAGDLLAITWFDKFGIERLAVDRALAEQHTDKLEGVLVLVVTGDSV
ncbi:MAG: hypothetical protein ACREQV_18170 [Candidatus Binatia bacterium]